MVVGIASGVFARATKRVIFIMMANSVALQSICYINIETFWWRRRLYDLKRLLKRRDDIAACLNKTTLVVIGIAIVN